MYSLDQYRATVVSCRYCPPPALTRPEALPTLKAKFYDAVARVVLDQPHMRVGIIDEDTADPYFVRLFRLDLAKHIKWRTIADYGQLEPEYLQSMQTQLDSRFDDISNQPGWRIIVLHVAASDSIEVLYVWNHLHHDGMSGKIFHQHLLRKLNEGFAQDQEPILKHTEGSDSWLLDLPNDTDRLPPNPEKLSWWLMTPKFFFSALWKVLKPPSIFPPGNEHAHWAPVKLTPFTTRFRTFSVDIDTVTKLVNTCREHHTTLTGLTHALALVSLTCALDSQKGFASRTPYDLRHILPSNPPDYPWLQPKETMCNYVSVVDHEYDSKLVASIRSKMPSQTKNASLPPRVMDIVWSVAARVRGEIKARLDSGLVDDWIGIMKFVSDWRAEQQGESDKTRYLSWLVTNLGVLERDFGRAQGQAEGWSARRAELVLSAEVPSAAISISLVTVKDEQMCVTCSWQDCVVGAELGARVVGDLERWLNEVGS